jgi:hypothetical protein
MLSREQMKEQVDALPRGSGKIRPRAIDKLLKNIGAAKELSHAMEAIYNDV